MSSVLPPAKNALWDAMILSIVSFAVFCIFFPPGKIVHCVINANNLFFSIAANILREVLCVSKIGKIFDFTPSNIPVLMYFHSRKFNSDRVRPAVPRTGNCG